MSEDELTKEVERLRGSNEKLLRMLEEEAYHRTAAECRVEAMREAVFAAVDRLYCDGADRARIATGQGNRQEAEKYAAWTFAAGHIHNILKEHLRVLPAPGPSAEDALRWAWYNSVESVAEKGLPYSEEEYVACGLADLARAPVTSATDGR